MNKCNINWYDPTTNLWKRALGMRDGYWPVHIGLLTDKFVFAIGSNYLPRARSVQMIDLSSESFRWESLDNMIVDRTHFQIGVLNDCVYAVS